MTQPTKAFCAGYRQVKDVVGEVAFRISPEIIASEEDVHPALVGPGVEAGCDARRTDHDIVDAIVVKISGQCRETKSVARVRPQDRHVRRSRTQAPGLVQRPEYHVRFARVLALVIGTVRLGRSYQGVSFAVIVEIPKGETRANVDQVS